MRELEAGHVAQDFQRGLPREDTPAGEQFVGHGPQAEQVGGGCDAVGEALGLLGREVGGSADHVAGLGELAAFAGQRGEAIVQQQHATVAGGGFFEPEIGGFDVAVDDAFGVGGLEDVADLLEEADGFSNGQRRVVLDEDVEIGSPQQRHDEVGHFAIDAVVEDGRYAGVRDGGGGGRLAEKALLGGGIAEPAGPQAFDCHGWSFLAGIDRLENDAVAT